MQKPEILPPKTNPMTSTTLPRRCFRNLGPGCFSFQRWPMNQNILNFNTSILDLFLVRGISTKKPFICRWHPGKTTQVLSNFFKGFVKLFFLAKKKTPTAIFNKHEDFQKKNDWYPHVFRSPPKKKSGKTSALFTPFSPQISHGWSGNSLCCAIGSLLTIARLKVYSLR